MIKVAKHVVLFPFDKQRPAVIDLKKKEIKAVIINHDDQTIFPNSVARLATHELKLILRRTRARKSSDRTQ